MLRRCGVMLSMAGCCYALLISALLTATAVPAGASAGDCINLRAHTVFAHIAWNDYIHYMRLGAGALAREARSSFDSQMDDGMRFVIACEEPKVKARYYSLELTRHVYDVNTSARAFTPDSVRYAGMTLALMRTFHAERLPNTKFWTLQDTARDYYRCFHQPFAGYLTPPLDQRMRRKRNPCEGANGVLVPKGTW